MINSIKLKTLVSLSFLIFILPFLRTCFDNVIEHSTFVFVSEEVILDPTNRLNKTPKIQEEILESNTNREQKIIEIKKESTFNFYQLLIVSFGDYDFKNGMQQSFLSDKTFSPFFCFLLVFINSFFILISAFINKSNLTFRLGILNFSLLLFSTIALYISEIVENINQFKIGYYLFAINLILIIMVSKKELKNCKL